MYKATKFISKRFADENVLNLWCDANPEWTVVSSVNNLKDSTVLVKLKRQKVFN